jgi:hypothetical protein
MREGSPQISHLPGIVLLKVSEVNREESGPRLGSRPMATVYLGELRLRWGKSTPSRNCRLRLHGEVQAIVEGAASQVREAVRRVR